MSEQKNIIYPKVTFRDISKYFWQGIRPYKWLLFFVIFAVVLINIIGALIPLFYKQFFDIIAQGGNKVTTGYGLLKIIIEVALLNGCLWILYRLHAFFNIHFQIKAMARLKQIAYDYLLGHSYGFFSNNFTGSLVQRVNRVARAFERLSDRITWDLLSLAIKVVSIIVIVFFINKFIALIIFVWALAFLLFNIFFSIWKIKYDLQVAEIDSKTTGYLADTITNQNTIQLFDRFAFESRGYKKVTDEQAAITKFNWNLVIAACSSVT